MIGIVLFAICTLTRENRARKVGKGEVKAIVPVNEGSTMCWLVTMEVIRQEMKSWSTITW